MSTIKFQSAPYFNMEDIHNRMDEDEHDMLNDVRKDKYAQPGEITIEQMASRVCGALYTDKTIPDMDERIIAHDMALEALTKRLLIPAGRIWAGAGTGNKVTLMNCYVMDKVGDSLKDIMRVLSESSFTMKQGGGIGMDFSPIRPDSAEVSGVNAAASGPLPFMDLWDAMCKTIMSAGSRRGAMMGTMICSHPDIVQFIQAKRTPNRLRQFNLSVLVTDEFMLAVKADAMWYLRHVKPPKVPTGLGKITNSVEDTFIYAEMKARDLWDIIMKSTYDYAEPGVIFVDRMNEMNNLHYCEDLTATNPCGEQPLPPYGACNLGSVNLSRMIGNPFTAEAYIDHGMLETVTEIGVQLLNNVIDVTYYPLQDQRDEQMRKRRIGLGIIGLADALAQLGVDYGSPEACKYADAIMYTIANAAYRKSSKMAKVRGSFPEYDRDHYLDSKYLPILNPKTIKSVSKYGTLNSHLISIAPTGTIALAFGCNVSSGAEPIFSHVHDRKVLLPSGKFKQYTNVRGYTAKMLELMYAEEGRKLLKKIKTVEELYIEDHLNTVEVLQRYVDSSISKTINVPKEVAFEAFENVYLKAFHFGLKGCTTYRPNDIIGSILTVSESEDKPKATPEANPFQVPVTEPVKRPFIMSGCTYKIAWPSWNSAIYITINEDEDGASQEVFIHSKDARFQEWTTAMSVLISAIMKRVEDPRFIARELMQLQSTHDTAWIEGSHYGSLVAKIGDVILNHIEGLGYLDHVVLAPAGEYQVHVQVKPVCPKCQSPSLIYSDGCEKCESCDYNKCG